jgi:threonine synthase
MALEVHADPENQTSLDEITIRCMACSRISSANRPVARCEACGGLLDVELDLKDVNPARFGLDLPSTLQDSGVWRYRDLLPRLSDAAIVSRGEGRTPIYWDDRLAAFAAVETIGLKHEGQNPTASFKDRGMTVGISHAKAIGARVVACASTGNTSASLASYAAAADLPALVLIPEGKIAVGKLAQTIAHGARIVQVEGDFDVALSLLRELTERYPVYLVNSVNPFRLEGQKTILIELLEQLAWEVPDFVALPGGNLGNTAAFGKAIIDLQAAGLIRRPPRLVTVQAEGAAPFADYFDAGFDEWQPVVAETVATAIKIGNPASMERARRAIERTDGIVTRVSDAEILRAKVEIDRVGIGCEPASAATLAGVRRLTDEGIIPLEARVVGILTGHVLKDTESIVNYHLLDTDGQANPRANRPVTIPAEMDALERTLSDAIQS